MNKAALLIIIILKNIHYQIHMNLIKLLSSIMKQHYQCRQINPVYVDSLYK